MAVAVMTYGPFGTVFVSQVMQYGAVASSTMPPSGRLNTTRATLPSRVGNADAPINAPATAGFLERL
jgi:hypothetical protein